MVVELHVDWTTYIAVAVVIASGLTTWFGSPPKSSERSPAEPRVRSAEPDRDEADPETRLKLQAYLVYLEWILLGLIADAIDVARDLIRFAATKVRARTYLLHGWATAPPPTRDDLLPHPR